MGGGPGKRVWHKSIWETQKMTYGYLRVSTDKQDENNQRVGVEEKARKMCVAIDEYVVDSGVSGTKEPEKRKLGALLEKLKPGDTIIASELSRLGRSLYMIMRILEYCMKHEVKVVTVKDNYELGDDVQSKVLAFAFALAAEIERDLISSRTKEAIDKKRKEGLMFGRPRGARTGCKKLKPFHDKIVGLLKDGLSYSTIAKQVGAHRNTLKGYCAENGLEELHDKKHDRGINRSNATPAVEKATTIGDLLKDIKSGMSYDDIGRRLGIHAATIRKYIQERQRLHKEYVNVQNKKRIEANGGLKINKQHRGVA
jgi:DNA invertase Pin-like site-specific DNA recombinase